ncbi:MAG: FAD-binding protein [Acidimicrobiia bacterium]|nr:FAD-binding protein [Acidimicrobiia bacterium]
MSLLDELVAVTDRERVTDRPYDLHLHSGDAGLRTGHATIVVFPETTDEVVAVVRVAAKQGVPLVARGAGTGLASGAVPTEGGIVLTLTHMNEITEINVENGTAWVGPGVINLDLSRATTPHSLHFAPDPSSQQACTIGGNIANNSGGPHCLSEGSTVNHVLAVEMVTADGEVITLGSAAPDPIGLDLRSVVVGSEGTLGIVTRALVKLTPNPPQVRTLLCAFPTVEGAAGAVSGIIAAGVVPAALEMMDQGMLIAVENWLHAGFPTESAAALIAEVHCTTESADAEVDLIRRVAEDHGATEVRVARDEAEREIIWKGRKSAFGAIAQTAPNYYLHDTVVPRTKLVETVLELYQIAEDAGLVMMNVFHAGDGNLHPLIAFDAKDDVMAKRVHEAADKMVAACVAKGGVLSGEHGIGSEKRDLMGTVFTEYDLDAQARLKQVFDPDRILNPAKILPSGSRCFDYGGAPLPEGTWI